MSENEAIWWETKLVFRSCSVVLLLSLRNVQLFSSSCSFFFVCVCLAHVKQARQAQMFAELEVRCWQQSVTEEHEAKEKEGRKKKCACNLNSCICSLLPIRQHHLSLHFSKLEIEVIPGLIKHAEMCADHKAASQFSLWKTPKWQLIFLRTQIAIFSYPENPPPRWTERSARVVVQRR